MNEVSPFLSIITVVYNNLAGLKYTYESIKSQTSTDFEWVIIDGGSTDGTNQWIVQEISLPNVIHISEKDNGLYDAMNKGLKLATGNYVWFMNSGDAIFSKVTIEHIISQANNSDVLYGETMLIDEAGKEIGIRSEKTTRVLPTNLSTNSMILGMVVCHQSFIPKRKIAPLYRLTYRFSADIDWVISCLEQAKKIHNCEMILSNYLVGGLSAQNQQTGWKERWRIYVSHYGFVFTFFAHVYIVFRYLWKNILFKKKL